MTDEPLADFESALEELERIVTELDSDQVGLDDAMALFESGIANLRAATKLLDEARGRVEELITESTGELRAAEFDPAQAGATDDENGGD